MKGKGDIFTAVKKVAKTNKAVSVGILICILGSVAFTLMPPLVLESIVNRLAENKNVALSLALLYFSTLAVSALFDSVKEALITIFGQKITHGIRSVMCKKLAYLPSAYFTKNEPGVTVSRFVNDVETVEGLFTSGIIGMFADVLKAVSILGIIFVKSRGLGILILLVMIPLFFITRTVKTKMLKAQRENRAAIGKVNNHIPDTVRNIRMLHTLRKEKFMADKYDKYVRESYESIEKVNFYQAVYSPSIVTLSALIVGVMMTLTAMGGEMQSFFGMSVGTAVALIAYVSKAFSPIESVGMEIQNIQSAVAGVKRINEFLSAPERLIGEKTFDLRNKVCVKFDNVDFSYDNSEWVLKSESFEIENSESVTFTGRTGAGKSTALKLILGLFSPQKGRVLVHGVVASELADAEKRRLFGYVEQSLSMVPGTLEDQIALYDSNISHEDVVKAAETVGLHEVIEKLSDGYNTRAEERIFSKGQWQLMSIARAIASEPKILLLDEITANLDSDTEKAVLEALSKASKDRTVISVSHRLYEKTGGRKINIGVKSTVD